MNTPTLVALVFVALTGDARFRVREAATLDLSRCGVLAVPALLAGEKQGCDETKQRCRYCLRYWQRACAPTLTREYLPASGKWPWIDGRVVDGYWNYLHFTNSILRYRHDSRDFPAWRMATGLLVIEMVAAQLDPTPLLGRLLEAERAWCRANNYPVPD